MKLILLTSILLVLSIVLSYISKSYFEMRLQYLRDSVSMMNSDLLSFVKLENNINNNILGKYSLIKFNGILSDISNDRLKDIVIKLADKELNLQQFETDLIDYRSDIVFKIKTLNER